MQVRINRKKDLDFTDMDLRFSVFRRIQIFFSLF